jgi:hypothetical protein
MVDMEREQYNSPEKVIQNLVDGLEIFEEIHAEAIPRGNWFKQYGNTSDADEEYEIKLNAESVKSANEAKNALWELGNKQPELLGQILAGLLNKELPTYESRYVISRTETGIQYVTPEPGDCGWSWVSGSETKQMIDDTVLGFGLKTVTYLESMVSKRSRNLAARVKRQELARKVKRMFIGSNGPRPHCSAKRQA